MITIPRFAPRLRSGDLVRVISFGLSLKGATAPQREICNSNLAALGLRVSFGKHVELSDRFDTSSVAARIEDLHDALADPEVKLILSGLGGMNAAQILNYIDWDFLSRHPKAYSGFSDIATLVNAIYAKTGIVTYYGPFYGTFGMKIGHEYMLDSFRDCLFSSAPINISPAPYWSDDAWWLDQENRSYVPNSGPFIITEGQAEGRIIGGHLTSLAMIFGTPFFPDLTNAILFLEDNSEIRPRTFDRLLQSVIHQEGFREVRALLLGRFTAATGISDDILTHIIRSYPELSRIPVVANLSFGHTYPQFTFPIGGTAQVVANHDIVRLDILNH